MKLYIGIDLGTSAVKSPAGVSKRRRIGEKAVLQEGSKLLEGVAKKMSRPSAAVDRCMV